jgi:hypothetical protein
MLRIYPVLLDLVRTLRPLVKELERHDPDLAGSVAGRSRALGYTPDIDAELRHRFDHVLGTLVRLVGGH